MPIDIAWGDLAVAAVTGILSGAGVGSMIDAFRHRKRDRIDAAASLTAANLEFTKRLEAALDAAEADTKDAREVARRAQEESSKAHAMAHQTMMRLYEIQQQAELLAYRLRRLNSAILDDDVTRDDLKAMANIPGPGGVRDGQDS